MPKTGVVCAKNWSGLIYVPKTGVVWAQNGRGLCRRLKCFVIVGPKTGVVIAQNGRGSRRKLEWFVFCAEFGSGLCRNQVKEPRFSERL